MNVLLNKLMIPDEGAAIMLMEKDEYDLKDMRKSRTY
jgi:hypothetical protein